MEVRDSYADPGRINKQLRKAIEANIERRAKVRYASHYRNGKVYEGYLEATYENGFTFMVDRGYRHFISYVDLYCKAVTLEQGAANTDVRAAISKIRAETVFSIPLVASMV